MLPTTVCYPNADLSGYPLWLLILIHDSYGSRLALCGYLQAHCLLFDLRKILQSQLRHLEPGTHLLRLLRV